MKCVWCGKELSVEKNYDTWSVSCWDCHIGATRNTLEDAYKLFKYVWGVKYPRLTEEQSEREEE